MNCNSNPRDLAFKRNYRCPSAVKKTTVMIVVFLSLLSTSSAFAASNGKRSFFHSTQSLSSSQQRKRTTRLPLIPPSSSSSSSSEGMAVGVSSSTYSTSDLAAPQDYSKLQQLVDFCADRAPGVAVSVALAQISQSVAKTTWGAHVSPLLWATILGMAYGNLLHTPTAKQSLQTGIKFSKGRLLRLGIILYGFKITLQQIAGIGLAGLMTDVFMVSSTLLLGIGLGTKWLGLSQAMSTLIGSGAAICGCSAVLATQPVVGKDCQPHEVSAAVGTVVLGGTLSMFLYPFLYKIIPFLAQSPKLMGIYTGATIHEIAGVVAAGNAMGGDVAFTAVVTKLARVLLLAPVLTTLSYWQNRKCQQDAQSQGRTCKLVLPWFAFGFVGVSALNSFVSFPTALVKMASQTSAFSLLTAMAALGIDSDFKAIRKLGSKPLILAAALWMWLAVGGLGVARFLVGA